MAEFRARKEYESGQSLIATALAVYCVMGLATLLLAAIIAPFFPYFFNVPSALRTASMLAVLFLGSQVAVSIPLAAPGAILWALERYEMCEAVGVVALLASAASTVAVLTAGGGIVALFAAGIPATLAPLALMVWLVRRFAPEFQLSLRGARRELVPKLLSFSTSSFIIQAANNLQTQLDELTIGIFLPISAVGAYYVARRLSALPQMLSQPILGAFLPLASRLHGEGNTEQIKSLYVLGTRLILVICLPLLCIVIGLAGPLLALWVGPKYADNAPIVIILAAASVLEVGNWPGRSILQGLARHDGIARPLLRRRRQSRAFDHARPILWNHWSGFWDIDPGRGREYRLYLAVHHSHDRRIDIGFVKTRLLPGFLPTLPMMAALYCAKEFVGSTGLVPVAASAALGLATYVIVYFLVFTGEQEQQFLRRAYIGCARYCRAVRDIPDMRGRSSLTTTETRAPEQRQNAAVAAAARTIAEAISLHAEQQPDRPAIVCAGFPPLSFRELSRKIEQIGTDLRAAGIGASSRVGIALPNGPEAAIIAVAVCAHAIGFPLNPALAASEFEFELARADLDAVVLSGWAASPATAPAAARSIGVFHATKANSSLDEIGLQRVVEVRPERRRSGAPSPRSVSVIQMSSGSTGIPKLILVTHANLFDIADKMRVWFGLSGSDRCACLLPISSGFGFKIALVAPLLIGGSVAFAKTQRPDDIATWGFDLDPTWFVATPTVLHAALDKLRAAAHGKLEHSLRFFASTSAYLPQTVRTGIQAILGIPALGVVRTSRGRDSRRKSGAAGYAPAGQCRARICRRRNPG